MKMPPPLHPGTLIRRRNRFIAEIRLDHGEEVTAHCPNSGSMKGCNLPGAPVLLSESDNPARKTRYTWEMVRAGRTWVGINTLRTNALVREAIENGTIAELQGYESIRSEVKFGKHSRLDFLLEGPAGSCYVEVKNVTLVEHRTALFPDAVTTRGQKHMRELVRAVKMGHRAVVVFAVQRGDVNAFAPADVIDPVYGKELRNALKKGVEALSYRAHVSAGNIRITKPLPLRMEG
jgi:sugar fermentation stimulation protein A